MLLISKMELTAAIFVITYSFIVFRNVAKLELPIWMILLSGAVSMVALNVITPQSAYSSIDMHVIVFLFSMFALVTALDQSGYLEYISVRIISRFREAREILFVSFLVFAFLSSFLMNDTLALMGTPIMLSVARKTGISNKVFLITLAISVTLGSVVTPMGNPQNLLVALSSGMREPVITFARYLLLPTVVNVIVSFLIILLFYRNEINRKVLPNNEEPRIRDIKLARVSIICTLLTVVMIVAVDIAESLGVNTYIGISEASLIGATVLLLASGKPKQIVEKIDWGILVMFASLFVIMQAVSQNGIISYVASFLPSISRQNISGSLLSIVASGIILSQLISNVPMVALYIPVLKAAGFGSSDSIAWTALAGASTIAGNLTIIGAASNLIIIERAEKEGSTITFFEFLKIGLAVTAVNALVLYFFLLSGL